MGNGKSTTGNMLIRKICENNNKKPLKDQMFTASKSIKAVTKEIEIKKFGELNLIDTPGLNDPDKTRTDEETFIRITEILNQQLSQDGLSASLLCIMIP